MALGVGPNLVGTCPATEAEPDTAGHGAGELAVPRLVGLSHGDWSSAAWHGGDPDSGDGASPVRQVTVV